MNLKTNTLIATLAVTGVMGLSSIADAKPHKKHAPPPHAAVHQHQDRRIDALERENARLRAQIAAMNNELDRKERQVRAATKRAQVAEAEARDARAADFRIAQLLNELRESRRREAAALSRARHAEARYAALNERVSAFEKKAGFAVRVKDWDKVEIAVRYLTEDEQWLLSQASY